MFTVTCLKNPPVNYLATLLIAQFIKILKENLSALK